ncbi:MAG: hypothetical protein WCX31_07240 [Salinivirgaceae bacterium]
MKYVILIGMVAFGNTLSAQVSGNRSCQGLPAAVNNVPMVATTYINEFPSKKEQFYNNWTKGTIYFTNGYKAPDCMIRYNGWKDELIWLRETDYKTGTVIKGKVASFTFDNTMQREALRFIHYIDTGGFQKTDIYLEVIAEGKTSVYCYRKATLLKGENKFVTKYQYYLKQNRELHKFTPGKRNLLAFFPKEKHKAIKDILRVNHLKLKNDEQLAEAIKLINGLE